MRLMSVVAAAVVLSGTALAASGDPQRRHTPRDQARARAIVLRPADLPGWRGAKAPTPSSPGATSCRSFSPDFSALVETGSAASPEFSHGRLSVSSHSALLATRDQATTAWTSLATPRLIACVKEAFRRTPGITLRKFSSAALSFPHIAPRVAAFRASFVLTGFADPKPARGSSDLVLLGRGRAFAVLGASSDGGVFPAALERRLAAAVAARMPR